MNMIKSLEGLFDEQLQLQKLRRESIVSKKIDIIKYNKMAEKEQERIKEIEIEIKEASILMAKLLEIKQQLKEALEEANCVSASEG